MRAWRKAWLGALLAVQIGPAASDPYAAGTVASEHGDWPAAVEAYSEALALNPYDRRALEALGEAYLELDRPDDARATLDRLADACRRLAHAAVDPLVTCAEWQDLSEAYEGHVVQKPSGRAKPE